MQCQAQARAGPRASAAPKHYEPPRVGTRRPAGCLLISLDPGAPDASIVLEVASRSRWTCAAQWAKLASGTSTTLGSSNERLDCDGPNRRRQCHVGDYGRQRGILRAGKHAELLQYARQARFQLGSRDLAANRE